MTSWCQDIPTVVVFSAAWCGPCRNLKPELLKLAEVDGVDIHFQQYETDQGHENANHALFGIKQYPTLLVFCPKINKYFVVRHRTASEIVRFARKVGELERGSTYEGFEEWTHFPQINTFVDHHGKCGKLQL